MTVTSPEKATSVRVADPRRDLAVERALPLDGLLAPGGDDHRLGLAVDVRAHHPLEVVEHDRRLLRLQVRMELRVPGQGTARLVLRELDLALRPILEAQKLLVGRVVAQDVDDELLLDRLAHGVGVKRPRGAVGAPAPEDLQGALLGRGREREEREVRLRAACGEAIEQDARHAVVCVPIGFAAAEHGLEVDR
jgi:hypothetical protein